MGREPVPNFLSCGLSEWERQAAPPISDNDGQRSLLMVAVAVRVAPLSNIGEPSQQTLNGKVSVTLIAVPCGATVQVVGVTVVVTGAELPMIA